MIKRWAVVMSIVYHTIQNIHEKKAVYVFYLDFFCFLHFFLSFFLYLKLYFSVLCFWLYFLLLHINFLCGAEAGNEVNEVRRATTTKKKQKRTNKWREIYNNNKQQYEWFKILNADYLHFFFLTFNKSFWSRLIYYAQTFFFSSSLRFNWQYYFVRRQQSKKKKKMLIYLQFNSFFIIAFVFVFVFLLNISYHFILVHTSLLFDRPTFLFL